MTDLKIASMLFAPATNARKSAKTLQVGADVAVLDLEDAVADTEKGTARQMARDFVRWSASVVNCPPLFVRVNGLRTGIAFEDLKYVVRKGLCGIVLPKAEFASDLSRVRGWLDVLEVEQGLPSQSVRLIPIIETGEGLRHVDEICSARVGAVDACIFGAGDFATEFGAHVGRNLLLDNAAATILRAARPIGMKVIDGPWLGLRDIEGLERDCVLSRDAGFSGRVVVHPDQVGVVNKTYRYPHEEDKRRLRRLVDAFEQAEARGVAAVRVDDMFVDYPIYRRAKQELEENESQAAEEGEDADEPLDRKTE